MIVKLACFLPLVGLSAILCLGTPVSAQRSHRTAGSASNMRSHQITRANFVSYRFRRVARPSHMTFTLEKNTASIEYEYLRPPPKKQERLEWKLQDQEMREILRRIDAVNYPALKPSYHEHGLYDRPLEDSTLTIQSTKTDKPLVYAVHVYGRKAPQAYYKLTSYLRELEKKMAKNKMAGNM